MGRILSLDSIVVAGEGQISSDLAGEEIILNLKSGVYYGLDEVGAQIWSLIREPKSVSELRDILLDQYDVGPDDCEQDLVALLEELAAHGLITHTDEPGA